MANTVESVDYGQLVSTSQDVLSLAEDIERIFAAIDSTMKDNIGVDSTYNSATAKDIIAKWDEVADEFPKFVTDINNFGEFVSAAQEAWETTDTSNI
ncbi:MAG TPA: hypothetical protein PK737_01750 [Bacilli bacterium]|nr:hypothetical protein [Bacilli bacterium]